jgi:TonB family protein
MVVSGSGMLGTLDDDQMAGPIGQRTNELLACKDRAHLPHYVGGTVTLRFRVARSGEVKRVSLEDSTLGSWQVERCALDIARTLQFSHPKGGEAEFSYPLSYAASSPVSEWDGSRVAPQMQRHRKDFEHCTGAPARTAPWKLTVYIGAGGKVTSAGVTSHDPLDDAFVDCVVKRVHALTFADPMGHGVRVSYQFGSDP